MAIDWCCPVHRCRSARMRRGTRRSSGAFHDGSLHAGTSFHRRSETEQQKQPSVAPAVSQTVLPATGDSGPQHQLRHRHLRLSTAQPRSYRSFRNEMVYRLDWWCHPLGSIVRGSHLAAPDPDAVASRPDQFGPQRSIPGPDIRRSGHDHCNRSVSIVKGTRFQLVFLVVAINCK